MTMFNKYEFCETFYKEAIDEAGNNPVNFNIDEFAKSYINDFVVYYSEAIAIVSELGCFNWDAKHDNILSVAREALTKFVDRSFRFKDFEEERKNLATA